ncbi:MAG TPA: Sua5/YciO/YrdC/YwlC family protein [Solirubrobacteraceae bacterium]|nr:Sua5/YciO/YrdC/YwlC family protein [Solirubrobacteraceae bacterium]
MSLASEFERCIASGGVAVFPADTVYGLACSPSDAAAVERLYALKGRRPEKPAAVMFFSVEAALTALPELGVRTRALFERIFPGGVTLLVPNPARRFPLAGGGELLGVRVVDVPALRGVAVAVLQSSANVAGGSDARRLLDVPRPIRAGADLVIEGGELPGTPSTVVDLGGFEEDGKWTVVRPGAVAEEDLARELTWQYHFDPGSYLDEIRGEIPRYDEFQDELVAASGVGAERILELGTGTGETARRLLQRHSSASLVGVDVSPEMLAVARRALLGDRVDLRVGRLEDPLPEGPFSLVASALCVHHLPGAAKGELFSRVAGVLDPGGRFVLADVVLPEDPAQATTDLTPGYDFPSSVDEQLEWMRSAGFEARVSWSAGDLAVLVGRL